MEISALYTVGHFRNVRVASLVVISDELADLTWKPGFKNAAFRKASKACTRLLIDLMEEM